MQANRKLATHVKSYLSFYIFVSAIFVTGVIFGVVLVSALTLDMTQEIRRHLGHFFETMNQGEELDAVRSFWSIFGMNVKWVLLIWLFGLSVIGLPLILVLDFFKGALIGFTVGFLAGQYAWKGLLFSLASVVPQNLILIPVMLIGSVSALSFSVYLVKNRFLKQRGTLYQPLFRYCALALLLVILTAAVSLYEAYLSPELMKQLTPSLVTLFGFVKETV
ncbi:stage II sporulation protein M [Gorillibacterium timonense]|uniref:stage II sporulation protein M n=1 Tax=Gorillibacterium timonense TaxID=1689269 RepID=UPI00071E1C07|nr:stage II sporulation protein M [Gorillibacterium timonense]